MIKGLISLVIEAVVGFLLGRRSQDLVIEESGTAARSGAAAETAAVVAEVADEQAAVAASGPDGADALAAELRARAARLAGGAVHRVVG